MYVDSRQVQGLGLVGRHRSKSHTTVDDGENRPEHKWLSRYFPAVSSDRSHASFEFSSISYIFVSRWRDGYLVGQPSDQLPGKDVLEAEERAPRALVEVRRRQHLHTH